MKELRDYQTKAISLLAMSIARGSKRPILQLATGAGKTLIAAHIIKRALAKGNRVIFVVPALSLIDQTVQAFADEGITEVGVIQGEHELTNFKKPVQVASIQTVARRKRVPDASLVIVDECHRMFEGLFDWMASWNAIPFIGLSATPWSKGLGIHYDDLIVGATTSQLIEAGHLSKFRVFAPDTPDLSKCRTVAGDYHEGDIAEAMDSTITGNVVSNWLKHGENRPTLCFGVNRLHAKAMAKEFEKSGVVTAYIDAYTSMEERAKIANRFQSGEVKVICNVGTMTTGVDLDVRCLILARPTKSQSLFVQIIGRALRTAEGKKDAIIFDHTGTHTRLGFVTAIHHDSLCDGKKTKADSDRDKKEEPLPKECKKCFFVKPPRVHECPACGFKPEAISEIEHEKGELVEIKIKKKLNRVTDKSEKRQFYAELLGECGVRGFRVGWAAYAYKQKFGVWPNAHKDVVAVTPSQTVRDYATYLKISNAQRKRA